MCGGCGIGCLSVNGLCNVPSVYMLDKLHCNHLERDDLVVHDGSQCSLYYCVINTNSHTTGKDQMLRRSVTSGSHWYLVQDC